jgi:hypothetical protein
MELLKGKTPSQLNIAAFGSICMVFSETNGRTFNKRATRGMILGIPEETKGCVMYLKEGKKVIKTQHVKYIATLSRTQNASLLDAPPNNKEPSNVKNGGAATPAMQPGNNAFVSRVSTHTHLINGSRPEFATLWTLVMKLLKPLMGTMRSMSTLGAH